jgi:hypothetical protein
MRKGGEIGEVGGVVSSSLPPATCRNHKNSHRIPKRSPQISEPLRQPGFLQQPTSRLEHPVPSSGIIVGIGGITKEAGDGIRRLGRLPYERKQLQRQESRSAGSCDSACDMLVICLCGVVLRRKPCMQAPGTPV